MFKKRHELLDQLEKIRADIEQYLNEYILALLKGQVFTDYEFYIPFLIFETDAIEMVRVYAVNDDGGLMLTFEYDDGTVQNEEVELEQLRFDSLVALVELLEPLTE